jgi:tRNA-Thr(GGU) m(6)t(6)A37 methyltransferase TsaA
MELQAIGIVHSPLKDRDAAPNQGDEGAPEAVLEISPRFVQGLEGICEGDEILVLTWLDQAARDAISVHPRGDVTRPATGVFATRSPDRPNPIGLHRVRVLAVDGDALRVSDLEALDRTPVLDLKPILGRVGER